MSVSFRARLLRWLSWSGPILVVAIGCTSLVQALLLWKSGQVMQGDFNAYIFASERLISGEGVYLPSLLAGETTTVGPFQYLYPPLLAQLLVPLTWLELGFSTLIFSTVSLFILAWAIVSAWRWAGGSLTWWGVLVGAAVTASLMPFYTSLFNGNIGLFIAGCVGMSVYGSPMLAGVVGGALKVIPGALLAITRRADLTRRAITLSVSIIAVSFLVSPEAWKVYLLEALPATVVNPDPAGMGGNPAALARFAGTVARLTLEQANDPAIATALEGLRARDWTRLFSLDLLHAMGLLDTPLRIAGLLLAAMLLVMGVISANDRRNRHVAAAYLTVGGMLVPWTLWDHYLVALLPLIFIAWRLGDVSARLRLALGCILLTSVTTSIAGPYLMLFPSMLLLLDGIRRTRLPETLTPKRPMPVEQSERR